MHEILFGQGAQQLYYVPVDSFGRARRVASATVSIVDLLYGENSVERSVLASTAATLGSTTATLAADAGPTTANAKRIALVSGASSFTVGRRYALTAATGQVEVIRVAAVDSAANRIETMHPILREFATGDTLQSAELEATFPAVVANDSNRTVNMDGGQFQVLWDYTIDGIRYLVPQTVRVQRYSERPWASVEDMIRRHPDLARRSNGSARQELLDALLAATEDVTAELEAAGLDPAYYRPTTTGKVLVTLAAIEHVLRGYAGSQDQADADRYHGQYKGMLQTMLAKKAPKGALVVEPTTDTANPAAANNRGRWVRG